MFIMLSVSDWLDGFIARLTKKETTLGKILDPVADKSLLIFSSLAFTKTSYKISYIFLKVLIIKELFVLIGALILLYIRIIPKPSMLGKFSTFFTIIILCVLFLENLNHKAFGFMGILYEVGIFLMVFIFLEYLINTIKIINQKTHKVLK